MRAVDHIADSIKADFEYWLKLDYWTLAECLCLAFGIEPNERVAKITSKTVDGERLHKMLDRANSANVADRLYPKNTPKDFISWLQIKDFPLPKGLTQIMDKQKALPQANDDDALIFTHKTRLLKELLNAANKFWANYDPTDKATAPTNKMVTDWLANERGVSLRVAENMAQILRADHLPTGRK